jgi:hypothetical protein
LRQFCLNRTPELEISSMRTIVEEYLRTLFYLATIAIVTVATISIAVVILKADLAALLLQRLASPS